MTVIARRVRARPVRAAHDTWVHIRNMVCNANAKAKAEFDRIGGNAASLISDEVLKDNPMVVVGSGARLRVYCLYDEDAVSGEDQNETALSWDPFSADDWTIYLPCPKEDMSWMKVQVASKSRRFVIYDPADGFKEKSEELEKSADTFSIDAEAFRKL